MIKWLNTIRKPNYEYPLSKKTRNSLLILLLGIILGVFSKWLDNLAINDSIWWQYLIGITDLGNMFSALGIWILLGIIVSIYSKTPYRAGLNVLLFFIGMCTSYHLYAIIFNGFNPSSYMKIWYGISLISPLFACICWYAKGDNKVSIVISGLIISIMSLCSFSIGLWYFYFICFIDTLIFILTIIVLYTHPKNTAIGLLIGISLAFIIRIFI